jgi:hypothetical protein
MNSLGDVQLNYENGIRIPEIGIGRNHHAASFSSGDDTTIFLANDFGYCFFSELNNLQAAPGICDNAASPTATVLSYTYGTVAEWKQHISRSLALSCCSRYLLHGTYDRGSLPSVALTRFEDRPLIVTAHRGIDPGGSSTGQGTCGSAVPFQGTVLDVWQFPLAPSPPVFVNTTDGVITTEEATTNGTALYSEYNPLTWTSAFVVAICIAIIAAIAATVTIVTKKLKAKHKANQDRQKFREFVDEFNEESEDLT